METQPMAPAESVPENTPFFQCPHCLTLWFAPGLHEVSQHLCKNCGRAFDPAQARCAAHPGYGNAPQKPSQARGMPT